MTQNTDKDTHQRLQKILEGAFTGSPTPLKDIPKKNGESRFKKQKKMPSQSKKKRKKAARRA